MMRKLLVALFLLAILAPAVHAFGAGNIPSFSSQEGVAFRHGDIADALSLLKKTVGSGLLSRGAKFSNLDVKRVYFGNFLRDYSQAMDVAALEKLPKTTILTIVMVLSFMAFGYATEEFEVTDERLGVYSALEHLDNPNKMYEGIDAKKFDPRLRGPVDPRELDIDPRSGMKNYLANEGQGWETSSKLIRQTLTRVIQLGRESRRSGNKSTLYEAYRELGKAMHAMEDLPAHSNWCELALHKLGYRDVFLHVGDNVRIRSPQGEMVAPLVTGSFGGSDFMHSMLGEASDHLSSASVSDLAKSVSDAKQQQSQGNALQQLMGMLGKVPGMSDNNVSRDAEALSRGPSQDPSSMSPQEMYANLFKVLAFHDRIMKGIEQTIEKIPGLSSLIENVSNSISAFTMTLIEPFIAPLMKSAMSGLHATSGAVVSGADQYEVFNNPNASNPTHSQLSKDHFALILNELAGNVAIIIDRHLVNAVVVAWDDESKNPDSVADECLAAMFHPYWINNNAHPVQKEMLDFTAAWARQHAQDIRRLDRANVRNHTNTRTGKPSTHEGCGSGVNLSQVGVNQQSTGFGPSLAHSVQGYVQGKVPGLDSFGRREVGDDSNPSYGRKENSGYDSQRQDGYSSRDDEGRNDFGAQNYHSAEHSGQRYEGQQYNTSHDEDRFASRPQHQSQHSGDYSRNDFGQQQQQQHHQGGYGGSSGFPEPQDHSGYSQGPSHGYQPPTGPPPPFGGYSSEGMSQSGYGQQPPFGGPGGYGDQGNNYQNYDNQGGYGGQPGYGNNSGGYNGGQSGDYGGNRW